VDDLIAFGAAVIVCLAVAAALALYVSFIIMVLAANAIAAGNFQFLMSVIVTIALVFSGYTATGLWLQRTGHI
jgi:hypothetical protein